MRAIIPLVFLTSVLVAVACMSAQAQPSGSVAPADAEALQQWQDWRFGMFIHWGPVALKGTEIGWSRGKQVPSEEYDQLYKQFNPVKFDAKEWAQIAKDAGMRYMVITSKHHDGFCIWDTKQTGYNIMNSPFGRDVLKELSEACKEVGIAFGTYHSILDWYQPDYNTDDAQGGPGFALPDGQTPSMDRYQHFLHAQVKELVENYGPLHSMWFDGEWEKPWTPERALALYQHCRTLDPKMLVNNRVGKGRKGMKGVTKEGTLAPGDYDTPEQTVGALNDQRPWETCMTICHQWAWKPDDRMKSFKQCIQTLVNTAGGDGNLLFNVGPMPDGRIEPRQVDQLRKMGQWLKVNGQSVYGTRGGPYRPGTWGCSTQSGDTVYVHVMEFDGKRVKLPALERRVDAAKRMDGRKVKFRQTSDSLTLQIPKDEQDPVDTIVVLTLAK